MGKEDKEFAMKALEGTMCSRCEGKFFVADSSNLKMLKGVLENGDLVCKDCIKSGDKYLMVNLEEEVNESIAREMLNRE